MILISYLQDKSGVPLLAYEKYQQPREVEVSALSKLTLQHTNLTSHSYINIKIIHQKAHPFELLKGVRHFIFDDRNWELYSQNCIFTLLFFFTFIHRNIFITRLLRYGRFLSFYWFSFNIHLFQKLVIVPVKKELGIAFKGNHKMVVEALEVSYCEIIFSRLRA